MHQGLPDRLIQCGPLDELREPEVYGLPPDSVVTTRDLSSVWRHVGAAAATMAAAAVTAFAAAAVAGRRLGGRR